MSKNIFIDSFGGNTIGVLAEDNRLIEYHIEKTNSSQVVGSIYKGVVKNVLDGMQAAFVDVGLDKNGYLFVGDMLVDKSVLEGKNLLPSSLSVKEGDVVLVQAVKDPTSTKGVRLTANITLAGKYVVYAPSLEVNAVSRKITDESTRIRLEGFLSKIKRKQGGFIARTLSENATFIQIEREAKGLIKLYQSIIKKYKTASPLEQIYYDGDLVSRLIRDVVSPEIDNIYIADKDIYDKLCSLKTSKESLSKKLVYFDEKINIFDKFDLSKEIESLLHNKVTLPSGAYFIIDKTEALTIIDVNTGSFEGSSTLEDTAFETNILSAKEIARQVRLRNISGIVVVDFINMEDEIHKQQLLSVLTNALKDDRRKCNVLGMSSLGLVEFTRSKKYKSISSLLNKTCPYCRGEGSISSNDYIVMKIRTSLLDLFQNDYKTAIIDVNQDICEHILHTISILNDIKKFWSDKKIYLIPHKTYHQEYFYIRGDNQDNLDLPDKAILLK